MTAPPPPQRQAPPPPWLAIAAAALVVGTCSCLGLGFWAYNIERHSVARRQSGREHFEKSLGNGWARYRFDDIGWTIDLPGQPVPMSWRGTARENSWVTAYSFYRVAGRASNMDLTRFLHKSTSTYTLDRYASYTLDSISPYVSDMHSTRAYRIVDGKPGIQLDVGYQERGRLVSAHDLFIIEDKSLWSVRSTCWQAHEAAGSAEWERMIRSIHFQHQAPPRAPK